MSCSIPIYAANSSEKANAIYSEYSDAVNFYAKVTTLFPEANIDEPLSFSEFSEKYHSTKVEDVDLTIIESYQMNDYEGHNYTLEVYRDGSYALNDVYGGLSGISYESGNEYRIAWQYQYFTGFCSFSFLAIKSYNTSTGYTFNTPSSTNVNLYFMQYYSLGKVSSTQISLKGNAFSYDTSGIDVTYLFGVDLRGTVNASTGAVSASHTYGPLYSW